jgi:hypothetical protein
VPDAKKSSVSRAVKLTMVTPGGQLTDPGTPLELELELQPLKPFETSVQIIINKASGGRCVGCCVVVVVVVAVVYCALTSIARERVCSPASMHAVIAFT